MKPWDSWIDEETRKNGISKDIQKTTISGNVNGKYMARPPTIRPPRWMTDPYEEEKKKPNGQA